MPLTANLTEAVVGTGDWILIASDGAVLMHAESPVPCAYTPNTSPPVAEVKGHPMEMTSGNQFMYSPTLDGSAYLWIRPDLGEHVEVTATDPV